MPGTLSDQELPGVWRDADKASGSGQKWTLRYARGRLGGSLFAAIGGAISFKIGETDIAAVVILAGFFVALCCELGSWVHQPEKIWYKARAIAESTKTLAWRYAVAADPFPAKLDSAQATELLRNRLADVLAELSDEITVGAEEAVVTTAMESLRSEPFESRKSAYIQGRTKDQQKWYATKADINRTRALSWRIALIVAEVAALTMAALRVFAGWGVDFAGLMAAVIAAGGAWIALKQYSQLAAAYSVAASELAIQADRLRTTAELDWPIVAADAEEAISREHTTWLASRVGARFNR